MAFSILDSFMFNVFPIIFMVMFVTIFIIIIMTIIRNVKQMAYNKKQPVLTVDATVVDKFTDHRTSHHHHDNLASSSHYTYYNIVFEVESGDRMSFRTDSYQYGMIVTGDKGKLTFQGTVFKGFERGMD